MATVSFVGNLSPALMSSGFNPSLDTSDYVHSMSIDCTGDLKTETSR